MEEEWSRDGAGDPLERAEYLVEVVDDEPNELTSGETLLLAQTYASIAMAQTLREITRSLQTIERLLSYELTGSAELPEWSRTPPGDGVDSPRQS